MNGIEEGEEEERYQVVCSFCHFLAFSNSLSVYSCGIILWSSTFLEPRSEGEEDGENQEGEVEEEEDRPGIRLKVLSSASPCLR